MWSKRRTPTRPSNVPVAETVESPRAARELPSGDLYAVSEIGPAVALTKNARGTNAEGNRGRSGRS